MQKDEVLDLVRDCIAGTISYTDAKKRVEEKFKSTNARASCQGCELEHSSRNNDTCAYCSRNCPDRWHERT